jgi:hypothetical protein
MSEEKKSWWDKVENALGIIIVSPLLLLLLVLAIPFILYFVLVRGPIDSYKKKQFLARNNGKVILCVTTSRKYQNFKTILIDQLFEIGVNDVVVFNNQIPNNIYDNFDWDHLITRGKGFPLLLQIHKTQINQFALKPDFQSFFKKEIDLTQLLSSIKEKMTHTEK